MTEGLFDLEPVMKSLLHETPIWAIILIIFRICWNKSQESRKHWENRFTHIELSIDKIERSILKTEPEELKRTIDDLKKTQITHQIEIKGLWELSKHLRRLSPHDLSS